MSSPRRHSCSTRRISRVARRRRRWSAESDRRWRRRARRSAKRWATARVSFRTGPLHGRAATTATGGRSEEHTSELQSLMRISYAVFCLKKKKKQKNEPNTKKKSQYNRNQDDNINDIIR